MIKLLGNKSKASTIALVLVLTIAVSLVVLTTVNAAVRYYTEYIYCVSSPRLLGVGQQVLLIYWTADMPPDIGEQTGLVPSPTGRAGWDGVTLTVTKPDNKTETIQMPRSDPVGGGWHAYTPDMVGKYHVQAHFPGTWKNTTTTQRYYYPADSYIAEFTVQEEPIQSWPESPVTTDYWTRPINTASREWCELAANWLGGAADVWPPGAGGGVVWWWWYMPSGMTADFSYGPGPESPHILWTKPYWAGGIMDARLGFTGYQTAHYQGISFSGIALNGILHYTPRDTAHSNRGWAAVDLYTGETIYYKNETNPAFASIYDYESPNQHGGFPYLWRTSGVTLPGTVWIAHAELVEAGQLPVRTAPSEIVNSSEIRTRTLWEMLDGYTGNTVCYIANVSSAGTPVYGKDGSILRYNIVNYGTTAAPNYYLTVWNSSAGTMVISQTGTGAWQWRPMGGGFGGANPYFGSTAYNNVHDGNLFWWLNVSIPDVRVQHSLLNQTGSIRAVREGEFVIVGTTGRNDERGVVPGALWALNLKRGEEGRHLWKTTFTPPYASRAGNVTVSLTGVYPEYDVFCFESSRLLKRWGYSLETGELLWESEPEETMNYYSMEENVYQGKLLTYGYGGQLRAYNITTGEILWNYDARTVGFESPYGGNYPIGIACIADGKIYTVSSEHSPTQPLWRGPNLRCIDAETGEEIWSTLFWGASMSPTEPNVLIADGIVIALNNFDMQIYAFGRGPSATTVTASPNIIANGSSIMITGTVTDQTPTGRRNINNVVEFTLKNTPAISDEDMAAWMEYKFMQQAYPVDAKGVEVTLDAIDPNGNFIHIGRVTSDNTGTFGYVFTPELEGRYQIIATFEGSAAYGASFATTAIGVGPAPEEPPEPIEPAVQEDIDRAIDSLTPILYGIIVAVVVAIVLVVYTLWTVRKRQ